MPWVLTRGLTHFREELNDRWPNRDKASDGAIGNQSHSTGTSGHNPDRTGKAEYKDGDSLDEVRAVDVDDDLREDGSTFEELIQFFIVVLGRQLGVLDNVFRYIIYNGRIWRASTNWKTETYTGPSKHTEHGHFSGAYTQASDNNTTFDYRLREVGNPLAAYTLAEVAQAVASKINTDLQNTKSGIYLNLVKILDDRIVAALNKVIPFAGGPGTRIKAAGWSDMSIMGRLDYLCELVMAKPNPDGTGGSLSDRLARLEQVAKEAPAIAEDVEAIRQQVAELLAAQPK